MLHLKNNNAGIYIVAGFSACILQLGVKRAAVILLVAVM
jgi:hypothetical protein